jgi:hypothetical protein
MITAPSGSTVIFCAVRACAAGLYSTTDGQMLARGSELTIAHPLSKFIAIPRAAAGCVQHLALDCMCSLHGAVRQMRTSL